MKKLYESLLDNEDTLIKNNDKALIEKFIKENYNIRGSITISDNNVVNSDGYVIFLGEKQKSLTNGLFKWGIVKGNFATHDFKDTGFPNLKSLEGAPEEVGGSFYCYDCKNIISLEHSPKKVGGEFQCYKCNKITSLKGAPEKVGKKFRCICCDNLVSLEGAPKKVGGSFDCSGCKKLKSLKGAPEKVGGLFDCTNCGKKFYEEDVREYSNVKGKIKC